jgi:chromosome segregation protein
MNLLSGGEKALTAIALMFSLLKAKPAPFCILDEVDAALDDSNIDRFCQYLKEFSNIQFTLITHQKETMEFAEALYGITMPEKGISRVISLELGDKETEEFAKNLN